MIGTPIALGIALAGLPASPAQAQPDPWQALADADLDAMVARGEQMAIGAVHPDPAQFRAQLAEALRRGHAEARRIKGFGGYRAVLQHFMVSFHDAHARLNFEIQPVTANWPGFLVRYQAGDYRIVGSTVPTVADGAAVTECDGQPIATRVEHVADYEIGLPATLGSTRLDAGLRLFVDQGNPFLTRPVRCTIGGRPVDLAWRATPYAALSASMRQIRGFRDNVASVRPFGTSGAWVRMGFFAPTSVADADQFRALMAAAPGLRNRDVIVLDVRGNGGGPYNWFMAFLRALYGQPYADHYATARLQIASVYRATPELVAIERTRNAQDQDYGQPKDPPFDARNDTAQGLRQAVAAGKPYFAAPRPAQPTGAPPPNPVKARVFVLTDYGCGSACIAFVDELKLFPGVTQIGTPTYVDSRTGTTRPTLLPSGAATVSWPTMTRDGRVRGDNVAQEPAILFEGDIANTAAVERWVQDVVLRR